MLIDLHTHTFPDRIAASAIQKLKQNSGTENFLDGTAGDLSRSCQKAGIDLAVILPVVTNPQSTEKILLSAEKINQTTAQTHLFSFGGIHPNTPNYRQIISMAKQLGLKGLKLHPPYQGVNMDDMRYKRILYAAEEEELVTVWHAGIDIGIPGAFSTPNMLLSLLKEVRPKRLVAAHMGGWLMWEQVLQEIVGQEVYLDTAFSYGPLTYDPAVPQEKRCSLLSQEDMSKLIRAHGAERVLFGTDSPWADQSEQLSLIQSLPLSEQEKQAILGQNAASLLGLNV